MYFEWSLSTENTGRIRKMSINTFVSVFFLSAGAHSGAGRDSFGGFLHRVVCGPGFHWRPVDERLFLLYASPLASHLPLCLQRQHHSRHRYDLTYKCKPQPFCFPMQERVITLCHTCKEKHQPQCAYVKGCYFAHVSHLRWSDLCFHHLQRTGCSSASPTPTPFLMVRYVSFVDAPCMPLRCPRLSWTFTSSL